jgi:ankyrin
MTNLRCFANTHETFTFIPTGEDTALSDQPYRYLTVDEMKSLGDDSLPIDVTRDERVDNKMIQSTESAMIRSTEPPQALEDSISPQHITLQQSSGRTVTDYAAAADNIVIDRHPQHVGYVPSCFLCSPLETIS